MGLSESRKKKRKWTPGVPTLAQKKARDKYEKTQEEWRKTPREERAKLLAPWGGRFEPKVKVPPEVKKLGERWKKAGYRTWHGKKAIRIEMYPSKSGGSPHECILWEDGTATCKCRGWISHRRCWHCDDIQRKERTDQEVRSNATEAGLFLR